MCRVGCILIDGGPCSECAGCAWCRCGWRWDGRSVGGYTIKWVWMDYWLSCGLRIRLNHKGRINYWSWAKTTSLNKAGNPNSFFDIPHHFQQLVMGNFLHCSWSLWGTINLPAEVPWLCHDPSLCNWIISHSKASYNAPWVFWLTFDQTWLSQHWKTWKEEAMYIPKTYY